MWVFTANALFMRENVPGEGVKDVRSVYTIDPTKTPKTLDVARPDVKRSDGGDDVKGETIMRAVYSLEGDVLKIYWHMPDDVRPAELATKEGDHCYLITLKREAADKGKPKENKEAAVKPPDDNDALQGTWQVIGIERGGRQVLDDPYWKKAYSDPPMKWTFKGDRLLREWGSEWNTVSTFSVDSSKTPKQMDETQLSIGQVNMTLGPKMSIPLLYRLEGDILTVCRPPDEVRPREFAAKRTNQNTITTLKRASAIAQAGAKPADTPRPSAHGNGRGEARMLQDWRDGAKEAFRLHYEPFAAGKVTVGTVIDSLQRLLDAELEGRTTQADRVAAYEAHLRRVKDFMKIVNQKVDVDANKIAPADAADGEAYLLKAEFLLEREKAK
jgi:uncharacterized protein (TIGR03067 family)